MVGQSAITGIRKGISLQVGSDFSFMDAFFDFCNSLTDRSLREKLLAVGDLFKKFDRVAIAFSGGVDSTLLVRLATMYFGKSRVAAFIAVSPVIIKSELEYAWETVKKLGVEGIEIYAPDIDSEAFKRNLPDKCYFCKREMFGKMIALAAKKNIRTVLDGTNSDDLNTYRPGLKAIKELGIVSPFAVVGLTKPEIREISLNIGIEGWNKPAKSCLATRIQTGLSVTRERLDLVSFAEEVMRDLGFRNYRCRLNGFNYPEGVRYEIRIEVPDRDMERVIRFRDRIIDGLGNRRVDYLTLDLINHPKE